MGIMLFEMLTGIHPFYNPSLDANGYYARMEAMQYEKVNDFPGYIY